MAELYYIIYILRENPAMNYYSLNHYMEICHLILNEKVAEADFAALFDLSKYKYNSDLDTLMEIGPYFGIQVFLEEGYITYRVVNKALFDKKYKPVQAFYSGYIYADWYNLNIESYYIAIKLLINEKGTKLDDIAEQIGKSRSTLRDEIRYAKSYMKRYNLTIVNTTHHGMRVEGKEEYIRLCLNSLLNRYNTNVILSDVELKFEKLFSPLYPKIKKAVIQSLKAYGLKMNNTGIKNLTRYLILSEDRCKDFPIICGDYSLVNTREYQAAKHLIDFLRGEEDYENAFHGEINAIAIYLICNREYINCNIHNSYYAALFADKEETAELTGQIIAFLNNHWNMKPDSQICQFLHFAVAKLVMKRSFGYLEFRDERNAGNYAAYSKRPLVNKIVKDISILIKTAFHMSNNVAVIQLSEIVDIIALYFNTVKVKDRQLNIGLNSINGNIASVALYQQLISYIDYRYVNKIELNDPNFSNKEISDYDIFIQDNKIYLYDSLGFAEKSNYYLEDINKILKKRQQYFTRNFPFADVKNTDAKNFTELLQNICKENASVQDALGVGSFDHISICNKIAYIFVLAKEGESAVTFGKLSPTFRENNKSAGYYCYMHINIYKMDLKWLEVFLNKTVTDYRLFPKIVQAGVGKIQEMIS